MLGIRRAVQRARGGGHGAVPAPVVVVSLDAAVAVLVVENRQQHPNKETTAGEQKNGHHAETD